MKKPLAALVAGLILAGCSSLTTEQQAAIDNLTPCEKINALLKAYDNRFEGLKLSRVNTKYMETWTAKYNLVGNQCQITALDESTITYRCQDDFSEQQAAVDIHQKAVNFTAACLTSTWHQSQKETAESLRTTFVLDDNNPVLSIHTGKTFSRKTPWSTSLEIGKPVAGK